MARTPKTPRRKPKDPAVLHRTAKDCPGCGRLLPLEYFGKNHRASDGKQHRCKTCFNAYQRQRWHKVKGKDQQMAHSPTHSLTELARIWTKFTE